MDNPIPIDIPPNAKAIFGGWTYGKVKKQACSGGCGKVFKVSENSIRITCGECVRFREKGY